MSGKHVKREIHNYWEFQYLYIILEILNMIYMKQLSKQ